MAMPGTDPVAAGEFAELERLWYELEVPEGVRLELIDGELVVSPTGSIGHSETAQAGHSHEPDRAYLADQGTAYP